MSSAKTSHDRIRIDDGVFVHAWMIWQDGRGHWWAYHDGAVMSSTERDDLLLQIARVTGSSTDPHDLRGRLQRSIEHAEQERTEDEAVKATDHWRSTPENPPMR